jgi:hemoglobin
MSRSAAADSVAVVAAAQDLDSPPRIRAFVADFYRRLLADALLAPVFVDVAAVDLEQHLPRICAYWEKMLLGQPGYRRHMMARHRAVHAQRPLGAAEFERWLAHFSAALSPYRGPAADRAWLLARRIARNMHASLNPDAAPLQEDRP